MSVTSLAGFPVLAVILPAGLQWGKNELLLTEETKVQDRRAVLWAGGAENVCLDVTPRTMIYPSQTKEIISVCQVT